MKDRTAKLGRKTKETDITVALNVDGKGVCRIQTGMPFLNHMLELVARHALMDLAMDARGDLAVDCHHTVEDLGLVLGSALDQALGDRKGIVRYGWAAIPMDESLSRVAVDLGVNVSDHPKAGLELTSWYTVRAVAAATTCGSGQAVPPCDDRTWCTPTLE